MTQPRTIKEFTEESNQPEKLIRAVVRQCGGWDSFKEMAEDVANHGANCGFSGFIYYRDTVAFTERNIDSIMESVTQLAADIGEKPISMIASFNCLKMDDLDVAEALYNKKSDERTNVFNALAWYALEEVSRSYCDITDY